MKWVCSLYLINYKTLKDKVKTRVSSFFNWKYGCKNKLKTSYPRSCYISIKRLLISKQWIGEIVTMCLFNVIKRLNPKRLLLVFSSSVIVLTVFFSRRYYLNLNTNRVIDIEEQLITSHEEGRHALKIKSKMKEKFHINIFDYNTFENVQNKSSFRAGPCVKTKNQVSYYQLIFVCFGTIYL